MVSRSVYLDSAASSQKKQVVLDAFKAPMLRLMPMCIVGCIISLKHPQMPMKLFAKWLA